MSQRGETHIFLLSQVPVVAFACFEVHINCTGVKLAEKDLASAYYFKVKLTRLAITD